MIVPVPAGMMPSGMSVPANACQCVGDHAVAADHDQRVGALVDGGVQQLARVFGVAADDGHDIDPALLQPCDRLLGSVRRVSVSRRRIGQDRHPPIWRVVTGSACRGENSRGVQCRLDRSQHLHAQVAHLVAHPGPVVAPTAW